MNTKTLAACATISIALAGAAWGQDASGKTIGLSFDYMGPFRAAQQDAFAAAFEKVGARMDFADANRDAQRQFSQVDTMISNGASAIISIPYDIEAAVGQAQTSIASGVPFISVDQAPADIDAVTYHVGGDPCADGKAAGEYFVKRADGGPFKLLEIQGGLFNDNGLRRSSCLNEVISEHDNIELVAQVPTDWNPEKALVGTENALQAHPDLDAIYTPWNDGLQGVFSALRSAGRLVPAGDEGHIIMVSIDGTPLGCQAVRDGFLDMDIATPIVEMAQDATDKAVMALNGQEIAQKTNFMPGVPYTREDTDLMESKVWGCKAQ